VLSLNLNSQSRPPNYIEDLIYHWNQVFVPLDKYMRNGVIISDIVTNRHPYVRLTIISSLCQTKHHNQRLKNNHGHKDQSKKIQDWQLLQQLQMSFLPKNMFYHDIVLKHRIPLLFWLRDCPESHRNFKGRLDSGYPCVHFSSVGVREYASASSLWLHQNWYGIMSPCHPEMV